MAKTLEGPKMVCADKKVRVTRAAQQYVTMVLTPNARPRISVGNNSEVNSHCGDNQEEEEEENVILSK